MPALSLSAIAKFSEIIMASSNDFREQLKAGNIKEALILAMGEAVQLKITTWVASEAEELQAAPTQPSHCLRTQINTIEGEIANEIGDQFIGNGPYRDILPFHLEQVAQSNQIIQNNLENLQKLFQVLVTLHRQAATYPPLNVENQLELAAESLTEAESAIALQNERLEEAAPGLALEFSEPALEEDVAPVPTPPPAEPEALGTPLSQEALAEETDWEQENETVLDLLESLSFPPPSSPEVLETQTPDEEWDDFAEEDEQPDQKPPESDLDHEDWGILSEDWEIPELENFESPPTPPAPTDEDKGETVEPEPQKPIPSLESLDLADDEDWDDWVVEEPELGGRLPLDEDEDDQWDDLVEDFDPFAAAPPLQGTASELEMDEDWDEFAIEELEPYSDITEADSDFEQSDPLADLSDTESALDKTAQGERDKSQQADSPPRENDPLEYLERLPQMSEGSDQEEEFPNPIELLFEEADSSENDSEPASSADREADTIEDALFEDISFEEISMDDFDPLAELEDDWGDKPKSVEPPEPPPPPPPSRFPDQKN
ncbi:MULTISPECIES: hypothetical protein [unclassified Coleofasciculus]|uniref:hypothetical protein n=1 Tax=unclassified Coleofasciculus TaxID=2692782 RepID=UPI00187E954B|nr:MULTISPECIES: hypothetical protein [unclassified Coleofasciculus]MBE9127021.1 hypothetical protein [Coleofasciculus sp. LEGE 07081]MBE9149128.1 hypothetical protein [Coleofasciculus sp. LEGE 07092]